ncbi:hypothetical protein FG05_30599 [Fusarium graminearum]|nr:hypothetical protein FG05_30599 [Fusarium graminearum]
MFSAAPADPASLSISSSCVKDQVSLDRDNMSGAEVLAGIGILCNVMQIVTFGKDALHVYRYVRENGTPDAKLETYLADASTNYHEMKEQLFTTPSPTNDQKEIIKVGEEAYKGLQKLRTYFKELSVDKQSRKGLRGKLRVAKTGIKTLFRGKELDDLEKNFQRYQQLLQTRLIGRICNQNDAAALLAQDCFKSLDATKQSVIEGIAQGHTDLSLLVSQKTIETKNHIDDQHKTTRTAIGNHLSTAEHNLQTHVSESTSVVREDLASLSKTKHELKRHEQLLASLRYPEMNARKNQVVTSFPKTFQWIFSSEGPWSDESSSSDDDDEGISIDDDTSSSGSEGPARLHRRRRVSLEDESSFSNKSTASRRDCSGKEYSDNEETNEDSEADKDEDGSSSSDVSIGDIITSNISSWSEPTTFTSWLGSESQMFWISGKPASGKSTLMKFIATSPATKEKITVWRPNVNILPHYFWKAGSVMERSFKGFLLCLVHQVLLDRAELSHRLLQNMPDLRFKWSHDDWDIQQLETVLLWALENAAEPFLLIIDGLDESEEFERHLSTNSQHANILDRLGKLKDVKICVSSREEYTFTTYFQGVERLQLHKLTRYDIRQFAATRLDGLTFVKPNDRDQILDLIVSRASGVFLWVALVLDSVVRAVRVNNNMESLIERIDHMPRDLIDLVQEMWDRSGEDGEIPSYRASASRYFNLAQGLDYDYHGLWKISILMITIASDKKGLESMLDLNRVWHVDELARMCSKTLEELHVVCHGLLEVKEKFPTNLNRLPKEIEVYRNMQVRFAHRCVIDFLHDTDSGAALLGACGWGKDEVKARLDGSAMVFARCRMSSRGFLLKRDILPLNVGIINGKDYILRKTFDTCLENIMRYQTCLKTKNQCQNILFYKCTEWHFAGIPLDFDMWTQIWGSIFDQDPVRNEFLASTAKAASASFMERLIAGLSTEDFLSALPAIFRGLSTGYCQDIWEMRGGQGEDDRCVLKIITLTKQILICLLILEGEGHGAGILKAVSGETREELQRLTCSWFLGICVGLDYDHLDEESKTLIQQILHLITLSLTTEDEWNQPIMLFLHQESDNSFKLRALSVFYRGDADPICFLTANLMTTFQVALRLNRRRDTACHTKEFPAWEEQIPHLSEGVDSLLQVVVSKTLNPKKTWDQFIWSNYSKEDADEVSKALLHTLLAGGPINPEMLHIEGQQKEEVARYGVEVMRYLINKFDGTPRLLVHPWSSWIVRDVNKYGETKSLDNQVDERSPQPLIELLDKIWDS